MSPGSHNKQSPRERSSYYTVTVSALNGREAAPGIFVWGDPKIQEVWVTAGAPLPWQSHKICTSTTRAGNDDVLYSSF